MANGIEQMTAYEHMMEDFSNIALELQRIAADYGRAPTEEEVEFTIRSVVNGLQEGLQDSTVEEIKQALARSDSQIFNFSSFQKVDKSAANTTCTIPVEPGKEAEAMRQITEYFSTHLVDTRDAPFKVEDQRAGQLKIRTTPEHAEGLSTQLEMMTEPSLVRESPNPWLTSTMEDSKIGITPPNVTPEQIEKRTAELVKQYIDDATRQNEKSGAERTSDVTQKFNLQSFQAYVARKLEREGREGDKDISNDKAERELTRAVAENIKRKEAEFKEVAQDIYRKKVLSILQDPERDAHPSDYFWAVEQISGAQYMFVPDETGKTNILSIRGKLNNSEEYFDIITYDFREKDAIKDVSSEDMRDAVAWGRMQQSGKTFSNSAVGAKAMHKFNENPNKLCEMVKKQLGFDPNTHQSNVYHEMGDRHEGMEALRRVLYMMRDSIGKIPVTQQQQQWQSQNAGL
jgi:hypothetical protein